MNQSHYKMTHIPLYYEAPLFIFILLGIYTLHQLLTARHHFTDEEHKETNLWLTYATSFLIAWSVDHIFHDLYPLPEDLSIFFHYIVSHGFLLVAIICISLSAKSIKVCHCPSNKKAKK